VYQNLLAVLLSPIPMDIHSQIQTLLSSPNYHPLRRADLAGKLGLKPNQRREFRRVLDDMVAKGEVVRVRKDRFVLPREADLVTGRIQFSEKGFAFVIPDPPAEEPDLYIAEEDTGVAMHGDRVIARRQPERRRHRFADKPSGRIIRILERAHATVVGTLQQTRHFFYVVPDDPRLLRDIYTKPGLNAQIGDKVIIKLAEWTHRHVNPEGEIIEVLGKSDAPGVDILSIIRKYHLPTHFTDQTNTEVRHIPDAIPTAEIKQRRDFRKEFIITIDPDDAKDFDDAVNVDELPGGGWRLGVHIADVSHYVVPGSALDREAHGRGNSVYLVDRVIPMLPEKLSNGLCSLRPREDRLTESCIIEFTPKLTVRKVEFALSVIHSRHRLTYQEAFRRLSSTGPHEDELTGELKKMWRLASQLRKQRFAQGALDLNFAETKVRLDKNGKPLRIEKVEYDISHQLIEEFMLAANEAVARMICELQIPCLSRIHEDPDLAKLRDFRAYAQSFGLKVGDVAHRRELQKLLAHVAGKPEEYAINLALLRSLKQARYSPQPAGHYGLAKKYYAHFTSPIRRYADLVIHRTVRALLDKQNSAGRLYSVQELSRIADHVSKTERNADEAEKESVELKKIEYFHNQLQHGKRDTYEAVVCSVRNFGIFVELPDSLVQGLVHISTIEDDFYHYDEQRERLVGKRSRRIIKIGDKLRVQIARVDLFKRQMDFRVVAGNVR
jgi:ribonuclease R